MSSDSDFDPEKNKSQIRKKATSKSKVKNVRRRVTKNQRLVIPLETEEKEKDPLEVSDDEEYLSLPSTSTDTPERIRNRYKYPKKDVCKFYKNRRKTNGEWVFNKKLINYFMRFENSPEYQKLKRKEFNTSFLQYQRYNRHRNGYIDLDLPDGPIIPMPDHIRVPYVTDGPPGEKYKDALKPFKAITPVMLDEDVIKDIAERKKRKRLENKLKRQQSKQKRKVLVNGCWYDEDDVMEKKKRKRGVNPKPKKPRPSYLGGTLPDECLMTMTDYSSVCRDFPPTVIGDIPEHLLKELAMKREAKEALVDKDVKELSEESKKPVETKSLKRSSVMSKSSPLPDDSDEKLPRKNKKVVETKSLKRSSVMSQSSPLPDDSDEELPRKNKKPVKPKLPKIGRRKGKTLPDDSLMNYQSHTHSVINGDAANHSLANGSMQENAKVFPKKNKKSMKTAVNEKKLLRKVKSTCEKGPLLDGPSLPECSKFCIEKIVPESYFKTITKKECEDSILYRLLNAPAKERVMKLCKSDEPEESASDSSVKKSASKSSTKKSASKSSTKNVRNKTSQMYNVTDQDAILEENEKYLNQYKEFFGTKSLKIVLKRLALDQIPKCKKKKVKSAAILKRKNSIKTYLDEKAVNNRVLRVRLHKLPVEEKN